MRRKVILSWMLTAVLLVMLSGCSGSEDARPKVSLIVKAPTLAINTVGNRKIKNSQEFLKLAADRFTASYDKADVSIQVEVFDYVDENEAIIGAYGTEHAVDLLYESYFNMAAYVSGGFVVPLDDLISEELRSDISDATWRQSMKNGKTYMMPFLSLQNILIYNKKLFKKAGLDSFLSDKNTIQNWTVKEWETILDTLAKKLPEGHYPMLMYANNNQGDTHIMSLIRSHGSKIFDKKGNFDFETPEAIKGLEWIQGGVKRGWYPPHPEVLEIADCQQLFEDNKLAVCLFNNTNYVLYDNVENNYGFVNFPGNIATSFITGFEVFDNGDAAKVQTAKDFLKFIYEDEDLMNISAGNIPESRRVAEKYADQIVMLPQFTKNKKNVIDFTNFCPNWQGRDNSVRSVFWPQIHELLAGRLTAKQCAANLNRDCNAAIHVKTSLHDG